VEVTDEMAESAMAIIHATREELARAVEAAFRDALQQRGCWQEYIDEAWMNSATRKALATPADPQSHQP